MLKNSSFFELKFDLYNISVIIYFFDYIRSYFLYDSKREKKVIKFCFSVLRQFFFQSYKR